MQMPISGVNCLLLDCVCWDKDRFGKDYMGEFDLALEDVFQNEQTAQEPKWYPLKSKRPGVKKGHVSGEVLLQFTILDAGNNATTPQQTMEKFKLLCRSESGELLALRHRQVEQLTVTNKAMTKTREPTTTRSLVTKQTIKQSRSLRRKESGS